jgi:uncharacterized metal-binding protein
MPDLPQKKVGIVACSGEELPEGTVTRLAALKVLEELRPADTVTICLPLFLAGGEGDRAFAKFYPTIAIDGCELRCAARGTEMYSGKPAASIVVSELCTEAGLDKPGGLRRLDAAGQQAVELTAQRVVAEVDELLGKRWSRRAGEFIEDPDLSIVVENSPRQPAVAACACGSGIPVQTVEVEGNAVALVALPLIFEQLYQSGQRPGQVKAGELLDTVQIYNPIPEGASEAYQAVLLAEYAAFCDRQEVSA